MYTKRRSQRWVARRRKPPHAPPRAPRATTLHGASDSRAWRVRSTRLTAQRAADVMMTSSWPSQQITVMGADVAMTWLHTWLLTSACPVNKMTVMDADVACHVAADASLTQPVTRSTGQPGQTRPGQRLTGSTGSDPTRSTFNRVNGSTGSAVNPTRSTGQPSPSALPRAATRFPTRRTFWWRVRAREREFWGNFGTYRFVSKFPTMWYIDLACLKYL